MREDNLKVKRFYICVNHRLIFFEHNDKFNFPNIASESVFDKSAKKISTYVPN